MNFIENLPRSDEHNRFQINRNTNKISQSPPAIFSPLLYTCTCFWKYGYWKISAGKTKFSSLPTKRVKSGISRFVRLKDPCNPLELHVFASDAKSAKEQCRQLLNGSAFLSYVSHSKPLLLPNYLEVVQAPVEVY